MLKRTLLFALILVGLYSCQQEEEVNPKTSSADSFDNSKNPFRSMQTVPQGVVGKEVKDQKKKELDGENASTNCSVEVITETRGIQSLTLLGGTDGIIYPGSLFTGESVVSGEYETITGITKRPMELTFTIEGLQGNPVRTIVPTNGNYYTEYNNILNNPINGTQPANISYTVEEIKSEEYLDLALGANFKLGPLTSVKADFNFNSQDNKTRILAKLVQSYFTVDMSIPEDGIYIEEYPDPAIFGQYSPMYISSLNYGRMANFFIETTYSKEEIMAALEASFKLFTKSEGSVSLEQKNMINSSTIRVMVRGGSGSDGTQSINGYNEFKNYVTQGGEMTDTSRGEIISYNLRNLSNHTNAVINLSADYEKYDCRIAIYQYWNQSFLDHVYNEDFGPSMYNGAYVREGIPFYGVPSAMNGAVPVYQYWDSNLTDHALAFDQGPSIGGYKREGIPFYAFPTQVEGTIPIYQYHNTTIHDHVYDKDHGPTMGGGTYYKEGVAFYAYPTGIE